MRTISNYPSYKVKKIISFIVNPSLDKAYKKANLWVFVLIITSVFIFDIFFVLGISLFEFENINTSTDGLEFYKNKWFLYLIPCLLVPVVEELSCRLFLKKSLINSYISLSLITFILILLFQNRKIYTLDWYVLNTLVFSFVIWTSLFSFKKYLANIKIADRTIFYASAVLFSLLHLSNYSFQINELPKYLFLIIPQFFSGLLYGYIRITNGMIYSILSHSIHNTILMLII
tara:strand:- start:267 stop:959 length:693 start_codon:yes stop_codon:yes gene_type:complete